MRSRQQGVSMIEVLVSIVVVAIGILGLTALQGVSMKNTTSANLRSTASLLTRDMADRMRANQAALLASEYDLMTGTPSNPQCDTNTCTSSQLAAYDYWRWRQDVANTLPMGTGVICIDVTPEDGTPAAPECNTGSSGDVKTLVVKVWWDDKRVASDLKRFTMVVSP